MDLKIVMQLIFTSEIALILERFLYLVAILDLCKFGIYLKDMLFIKTYSMFLSTVHTFV
jgi:hypothetical protein